MYMCMCPLEVLNQMVDLHKTQYKHYATSSELYRYLKTVNSIQEILVHWQIQTQQRCNQFISIISIWARGQKEREQKRNCTNTDYSVKLLTGNVLKPPSLICNIYKKVDIRHVSRNPLSYNCYNFPTHAQFLTTLLPIPAYMFRPLWAIIRAL
jgi:hypothetical protein